MAIDNQTHPRGNTDASAPRGGRPQQPSNRNQPRRTRARLLLRIITVVTLAVVFLGVGAYAYLRTTSGVTGTGTPDCSEVPVSGAAEHVSESGPQEMCEVIAGLERAWAANDAAAYGAAFTPEATYTTFAGTHYAGREDIVEGHAALFDSVLADSRLTNSYLALRFLTDDVAVLTTRGDTYEGDEPGAPTKVQTYTFVRDGGTWQVAAFQNTQRQPVMERIQYLWMPDSRPAAER